MSFSHFFDFAGSVALPGLAPAGEVLLFASPKKSTQKKGEPDSSALRFATGTLRCSQAAGSAETRLTPQTSALLSPPLAALLASSLRRRQPDTEVKDAPMRVLVDFGLMYPVPASRVPLWLCRGAQTGPEIGLRMFEPVGRVCADPGTVEHRRLPRRSRGHRHQGRFFFGDFLLATQKKVTALSGAHPDIPRIQVLEPEEVSQTC